MNEGSYLFFEDFLKFIGKWGSHFIQDLEWYPSLTTDTPNTQTGRE